MINTRFSNVSNSNSTLWIWLKCPFLAVLAWERTVIWIWTRRCCHLREQSAMTKTSDRIHVSPVVRCLLHWVWWWWRLPTRLLPKLLRVIRLRFVITSVAFVKCHTGAEISSLQFLFICTQDISAVYTNAVICWESMLLRDYQLGQVKVQLHQQWPQKCVFNNPSFKKGPIRKL